jgi:stress-induced morphogen
MAQSTTPMEDAIRTKITNELSPTFLEIQNDSHLHAHHQAMQGSTSREVILFSGVVSDPLTKADTLPSVHYLGRIYR